MPGFRVEGLGFRVGCLKFGPQGFGLEFVRGSWSKSPVRFWYLGSKRRWFESLNLYGLSVAPTWADYIENSGSHAFVRGSMS